MRPELTLLEEFLSACFVAAMICGPMLWVYLTSDPEDLTHLDDDPNWDDLTPVERRHPSLGNVRR